MPDVLVTITPARAASAAATIWRSPTSTSSGTAARKRGGSCVIPLSERHLHVVAIPSEPLGMLWPSLGQAVDELVEDLAAPRRTIETALRGPPTGGGRSRRGARHKARDAASEREKVQRVEHVRCRGTSWRSLGTFRAHPQTGFGRAPGLGVATALVERKTPSVGLRFSCRQPISSPLEHASAPPVANRRIWAGRTAGRSTGPNRVQTPARVNVTCVTPLGAEVASIS